jgi:O-antigen/teichoic acid export membrane protein
MSLSWRFSTVRVSRLVKNATALIISGGATAVLGVVFWGVVTRVERPAFVGRASAEIAAITVVATVSQLALPAMFELLLPMAGHKSSRIVIRCYELCVFVSIILGSSYVALGLAHKFLPSQTGWEIFFIVSIAAWTIFALQDSVLVGLRETKWVPVENIVYSVLKLAVLPVFVAVSKSNGIILAWICSLIPSLGAVNIYIFRKRLRDHEADSVMSDTFPSGRQIFALTSARFAVVLINTLSPMIVVLIVIQRLGPVASAHYYLPAQISTGVGMFLWSTVRSFIVEASFEPDVLRQHVRVAIRSGALILGVSVAVGVAAAPQILGIFGTSYAASGTTLMRLLLLSLLGFAVTDYYSALAWLDRKVWSLVVRELLLTSSYFVIILLTIGHLGILSIGVASIIMASLQTLIFLGPLIKRYRRMTAKQGPAPV